jgi:hypothetical protein
MVDRGAVYPEESRLSLALRQSLDIKFPEEAEEVEEKEAEGPARSWEEVYRPSRTGLRKGRLESVERQRKASTVGKVVNLATWDTSTSYNMGPLSTPGERPFSDLQNTVEVTPNFADWYFLSHRLQFTNDFYSLKLLNFDVSTSVSFTTAALGREEEEDQSWDTARDPYGRVRNPGDEDLDPNVYNIDTLTGRRYEAGEGMGQGWNFSLTHDYSWTAPVEGSEAFSLHAAKAAFSFDLTKKWRLGYDIYYDVKDGELISQHYRLFRNLHRWEAELRVAYEREDVIYWFQVRLIDIPEIQLYGQQERTIITQ